MLLRRSALLTATFACVALALPAFASAKDYCFGNVPGCTPAAFDDSELQLALTEAQSNGTDDRFFLSPPAQFANGPYTYDSPERIEIIGAGPGQTTLSGPPGISAPVLNLRGGAGSSVHDLTIRLPQNAASGLRGLTTANTARRIEVIEDPTQANPRWGVDLLDGGTLEDSSVTLNSAQATTAVLFGTGGGAVRRSLVSGRVGVDSAYGGTIERSRVTASNIGVEAIRGVTTITASAIRFTAAGGAGIEVDTQAGGPRTVNGDGVTIVGPGLPDTYGAYADTLLVPAESADISLTNSIIRGVSIPLRALAAGSGHANVAASYSDYDPSGNVSAGANAKISEANVSNVGEAGFADAAGGDYRLLAGSPLLDAGDPATAQGLDLDGNLLIADGNGDGIARRDLGAFELQPAASPPPPAPPLPPPPPPLPAPAGGDNAAPTLSGMNVAPRPLRLGRALPALTSRSRGPRIALTVSERATLTFRFKRRSAGTWKTVRGQIRIPASPVAAGKLRVRFAGRLSRTRALTPGRYRVVATATDAAGNRSKPATARFRLRR